MNKVEKRAGSRAAIIRSSRPNSICSTLKSNLHDLNVVELSEYFHDIYPGKY